jgi:hypothetical protein
MTKDLLTLHFGILLDFMNLTSSNTVFCDSKYALNQAHTDGLSLDAAIFSSSPAMLMSNLSNIHNIELRWNQSEMKKFQTSINKFSRDIFDKANSLNINREKAISIAQTSVFFHSFLFKAACLKKEDLKEPRLIIKVNGNSGPQGVSMNAPWDVLLVNNPNLKVVSYNLPNDDVGEKKSKVNLYSRFRIAGYETIIFRMLTKLYKFVPNFIFRGDILVAKENELIIETSSALISDFYRVRNIKIKKIPVKFNNNYEFLNVALKDIVTKRLGEWVIPELVTICEHVFFEMMQDKLSEIDQLEISWHDYLSNQSNIKAILTNYPCNSFGFSLAKVCRDKNILLVSAQHGIGKEIQATKENEISYEINCSDIVLTYNKLAANIADKSYFSYGKSFVSGLSMRHLRMKNSAIIDSKKIPICYISTNLYKGNISGFDTWHTDIERARVEKLIIDEILMKLPHKVQYKAYPEENKRYSDVDPIIEYLKNQNNIELFIENIDMRYLVSNFRLFITSSATSTLTWPLMSEKPVVLINYNNHKQFDSKTADDLSKALFMFNFDEEDFLEKIVNFLSKSIQEIEKEWNKKLSYRQKVIQKYFSEYSQGAGKRSAKIIKNAILNKN